MEREERGREEREGERGRERGRQGRERMGEVQGDGVRKRDEE